MIECVLLQVMIVEGVIIVLMLLLVVVELLLGRLLIQTIVQTECGQFGLNTGRMKVSIIEYGSLVVVVVAPLYYWICAHIDCGLWHQVIYHHHGIVLRIIVIVNREKFVQK